MRISIAMATCNGARYLGEQLDSLAGQTLVPDQLVITDDASDDDTEQIARRFAERATFQVDVHASGVRLGVTANFDRALAMCDGDLVLLCDQDDVWFPRKIEVLHEAAAMDPSVGCWMVDAVLADANLVPGGATKLGNIRKAGLPDNLMMMGCCAAFRRELLDLLLPIPASQPAHDNWLVQFSDLLGLTRRLETPMQYYRRHGANVSQVSVNQLGTPGVLEKGRRLAADLGRRARGSEGLLVEHVFFAEALKRMRERPQALAALVGDRTADILAHCAARTAILATRIRIKDLPIRARLACILRLWRDGGYRESGGVKGVLKDLVAQ